MSTLRTALEAFDSSRELLEAQVSGGLPWEAMEGSAGGEATSPRQCWRGEGVVVCCGKPWRAVLEGRPHHHGSAGGESEWWSAVGSRAGGESEWCAVLVVSSSPKWLQENAAPIRLLGVPASFSALNAIFAVFAITVPFVSQPLAAVVKAHLWFGSLDGTAISA